MTHSEDIAGERRPRVVAVVGSYRRSGVTDSLTDAVLEAAAAAGAETEKFFLMDLDLRFCTNCRACTQQPGEVRGECPHDDDMGAILDALERCDAFILASPMNFWTVTAVMKLFIERLVLYAHWPWGQAGPAMRIRQHHKRAAVVASSAAPELIARWTTPLVRLLKKVAKILGAKKTLVLFKGMAASKPTAELDAQTLRKTRAVGRWLAGR